MGEAIHVSVTFGPTDTATAEAIAQHGPNWIEYGPHGSSEGDGAFVVEGDGNYGVEDDEVHAVVAALVEAGIGYDLHQSAKYEYPAIDRCWRPGWDDEREGSADEDGPTVHLSALEELPPGTTVAEVLARYDIWMGAAPLHWTPENPAPTVTA